MGVMFSVPLSPCPHPTPYNLTASLSQAVAAREKESLAARRSINNQLEGNQAFF